MKFPLYAHCTYILHVQQLEERVPGIKAINAVDFYHSESQISNKI